MLRTVLKSDRLVLLSARGNVVPGIQREVRVAAIIEQFLSHHCTVLYCTALYCTVLYCR